ncbi:acyl-CoA dehydrogenase family protein [Pseudonocardia lutea]|uniref:Acyl-CoA dehydrogenase family protein n=1 Tax=Pseudonocardia lutea TaxID=2172015 RepID=A0ABW1IA22_9PSEU
MRFALSEDQQALADGVSELLTAEATGERLRKVVVDPGERTGALWGRLRDLGVFGALVPEDRGGLGLGGVETVLVAEQLGRHTVPGPVAETALVAGHVLGRWGGAAAKPWLARLAEGDAVIGVRTDPGGLVVDADLAHLVLAAGPDGVVGSAAADLTLTAQPGVDPTRRHFAVAESASELLAQGEAAAAALRRAGAVTTAAQLVGAGAAVLDQAVAYAQERAQFGRVIGSYQAVKHQLATVRIALDFARPLVLRAGLQLDGDGGPVADRDAVAAKTAAADAARLAAGTALQVHGGIGYTDELDLQLWLKRIWSLLPEWGTAEAGRREVLRVLLGDRRPVRYP